MQASASIVAGEETLRGLGGAEKGYRERVSEARAIIITRAPKMGDRPESGSTPKLYS